MERMKDESKMLQPPRAQRTLRGKNLIIHLSSLRSSVSSAVNLSEKDEG
jgi:hypothetical protein